MKWMILLIPLLFMLTGCASLAGWWSDQPDEIRNAAIGMGSKFLSGNSAGAIGQGIDLILMLTGLKAVQKTGQIAAKVVKKHVLNKPVEGQVATKPSE
jgi:hypothetical protein